MIWWLPPFSLSTILSNIKNKNESRNAVILKNIDNFSFFLRNIQLINSNGLANQHRPAPVEKIAAHPNKKTMMESLQLEVVQ